MTNTTTAPTAVSSARLTALAHDQMPFTETLGIDVIDGSPARVRARGSWQPDRCTAASVLHGGYLMAVADSVGAMCAVLNLPHGAQTATIESKTNFLGAVTSGDVTVTAEPMHVGRTTIVVQTDVTDEADKLVTRTTQTQAIIP